MLAKELQSRYRFDDEQGFDMLIKFREYGCADDLSLTDTKPMQLQGRC